SCTATSASVTGGRRSSRRTTTCTSGAAASSRGISSSSRTPATTAIVVPCSSCRCASTSSSRKGLAPLPPAEVNSAGGAPAAPKFAFPLPVPQIIVELGGRPLDVSEQCLLQEKGSPLYPGTE